MVPVPTGAVDWCEISPPPSINHLWACREAPQNIQGPVDNIEDGDASSDDDDGFELEPVVELEDVGFIGDLDCILGEGEEM